MKHLHLSIILLVFVMVTCQKRQEQPASNSTVPAENIATDIVSGKVQETMNSGGYTYIRVNDIWAAAPECDIVVGEEVSFRKSMPMDNFASSRLDRTFDKIYFINSINKGKVVKDVKPEDLLLTPGSKGIQNPTKTTVAGIKKVKDGITIADLFRDKDRLNGKKVLLRGKVVKFSPQIMNTNWLHVQDGTEYDGFYDLIITSNDVAKTGDQVIVNGTVVLDKDFGYGYKYNVLVTDANIVVE